MELFYEGVNITKDVQITSAKGRDEDFGAAFERGDLRNLQTPALGLFDTSALDYVIESMKGSYDFDKLLAGVDNASASANHSHANKALLDTYDQTNANIKDAVSKKHSHSNMTVLNGITSDKVSAWDGKCHLYVSSTQPTGMTENDLWAKIVE